MAKLSMKWYYGEAPGYGAMHEDMPLLIREVGSMRNVLNAILVDGFGQRDVSSITVNGSGVAEITTATPHGYKKKNAPVELMNADQDVNGEYYVKDFDDNRIWIELGVGNANLSVTSSTTLQIRVPPLGWERPFEDAANGKAVYRSPNLDSNRYFLRIEDIGIADTYARGYESMTDVDTGVNPFGYPEGRFYYSQYEDNDDTHRYNGMSYFIVGDDKRFYVGVPWLGNRRFSSGYRPGYLHFFGDGLPYGVDDGFTLINVFSWDIHYREYDYYYGFLVEDDTRTYVAKSYDGSIINVRGSDHTARIRGNTVFHSTGSHVTSISSLAASPNMIDGKIRLTRGLWYMTREPNTGTDHIRGEIPSFYYPSLVRFWVNSANQFTGEYKMGDTFIDESGNEYIILYYTARAHDDGNDHGQVNIMLWRLHQDLDEKITP